MKDRNIAVIGCGYWGKNLVRNFYNLKALRAICDSDKGKEKENKALYHEVSFASSFDEALRDPLIKAVAIASPAETHYALVKKALLRNKDVFVEKPLALNVKDGEELVKIARQNKRILMVDHLLQYHPALIKLKEIVENGVIGDIRYIYSNRLSIGKFRKEENILWSFAPHDVSVILSLVKQMPKEVEAFGGVYLQKGVYDTTLTTLVFDGGLRAHIFVNWLHPFKEQKLVVIGTKNMAVFDDQSQDKLVLYPHKVNWVKGIPVASKAPHKSVKTGSEEPLENACRHFLSCIDARKTPLTDGEEALRVLRVLNRTEEALKRKKYGKNK